MSEDDIQKQLDDLRTRVEKLEKQNVGSPIPYPIHPGVQKFVTNKCSKCGISLEGLMMYSCQDIFCPCGLGSSVTMC